MAAKTTVVVFLFIILFIATTAAIVNSFRYLESADTCNSCHPMQPYVVSFINPTNGSVISDHLNITCVDCHGGTIYQQRLDAQLTIAKKIISYGFIGNISGVDTILLDVNCIDCHPDVGDSIAHRSNSSCGDCHIAHRDTLLPHEFNELECSKCHKLPEMGGGHAPMDCRACHIRHKYKPNCTQCHPPHAKVGTPDEDLAVMSSDWTNDVCIDCHSNHHSPSKKLVFSLSQDLDKELCAGCHREYDMLKTYGSFHNNLQSCANCHINHGKINVRSCNTRYCHMIDYEDIASYKSQEDLDALHSNFPVYSQCNGCHGISHMEAHSLSCASCHNLRKSGCTGCHDGNIHKLKA